ncbi:ABC transporter ATP-binding protein [Lactiplantibacillus plantarum]|nr:ABC transporter ATP-binding protein [Lactiplantibacillus plantarum]RZN66124.1 ABC transporter ATP-binding protein [Lactiplantibacillus plantarum]TPV62495.1 ABC transporter ATP-binding protein [Lactiplantibacillus plantarum]
MVNTILREADLFLSEQRRINFTIYPLLDVFTESVYSLI